MDGGELKDRHEGLYIHTWSAWMYNGHDNEVMPQASKP